MDSSHQLWILHNPHKYSHDVLLTKTRSKNTHCFLWSNAISLKFYHNILLNGKSFDKRLKLSLNSRNPRHPSHLVHQHLKITKASPMKLPTVKFLSWEYWTYFTNISESSRELPKITIVLHSTPLQYLVQ